MIARGFVVLGTNLRVGRTEIDILARRGPLVALVEVRTRGAGSILGGFASIDGKKRRHLAFAAKGIWQRIGADRTIERLRVDVAVVHLGEPVSIEIAEGVLTL